MSRPGESHPRALAEPYVNVSAHTAPISQPLASRPEGASARRADDVAFIQSEHGYAIGRELERRGVKKEYYLETRCDVLVKNREVFAYWKRLGLHYMFLGLKAIVRGASQASPEARGPRRQL